jgi:hypothetical protein
MALAFFGLGFTCSQDSTCPKKSISNRANSVFAWFLESLFSRNQISLNIDEGKGIEVQE